MRDRATGYTSRSNLAVIHRSTARDLLVITGDNFVVKGDTLVITGDILVTIDDIQVNTGDVLVLSDCSRHAGDREALFLKAAALLEERSHFFFFIINKYMCACSYACLYAGQDTRDR